MHYPLVSIIIPSYNRFEYLKEALLSAIHQDYSNIEIIVVFDGGNHEYYLEIKKIFIADTRVSLTYKSNGGVASALNTGIRAARGKFVCWLSDDDRMEICHISNLIKGYESVNQYQRSKNVIVYTGFRLMDGNGICSTEVLLPEKRVDNLELIECGCYPVFKSLLHGCSMLIEKALFVKYGYFREDLITTQDYHLWFKFLRKAQVKYVSGSSLHSRVHASQTSNILSELHLKECNELWAYFIDNIASLDESLFFSEIDMYINFYNHLKYSSYQLSYQHLQEVASYLIPNIVVIIDRADIKSSYKGIYAELCQSKYSELFKWFVVAKHEDSGVISYQLVGDNTVKFSKYMSCGSDYNVILENNYYNYNRNNILSYYSYLSHVGRFDINIFANALESLRAWTHKKYLPNVADLANLWAH
jgi:glycosyltransferase involved in cell wall biosynthesis